MVSLDRVEIIRALAVSGGEVPMVPEGVSGVTHDSREVGPGIAFVAVPGFKRDGARFVPEAVRRGAALIVAEREVAAGGVPVVVVEDARSALAGLASAVNGDPSREMEVYGVTGTNGKTTTSYVLHGVLSEAFGSDTCGLMTTAETIFGGERHGAVRTTPEATEVQATLARMLRGGVRRVVMEVSSHGITLRRVAGTSFAGALFTNLTRDHLDLHGSMEEYYRAKRELFYMTRGPRLANADDEWGRRLAREVEGVETFGHAAGADFRIGGVRASVEGTHFTLNHPGGAFAVETPLLGAYNVLNVAGAVALALRVGVPEEDAALAAREMRQVPGRFERVGGRKAGVGFEVIVDYAHTDVGLEALLEVARETTPGGRVICVLGAAGERDRAKRPLMGEVASRLADESIITTDDAYGEDPAEIAREVAAGVTGEAEVILDRRQAIETSLSRAGEGDVVVIAGKGHETVQHLPEGDVPFHDPSVVAELLAGRDQAASPGGGRV